MTLLISFCAIFPIIFYYVVRSLLKKYKNIDLSVGIWRDKVSLYEDFIAAVVMLFGLFISFIIYVVISGDYSVFKYL